MSADSLGLSCGDLEMPSIRRIKDLSKDAFIRTSNPSEIIHGFLRWNVTSSKCCFTPSYYRFINVAMELLRAQKVQNCSFYQYQMYIITAHNSSCGKVMFSEACVSHSVLRGLGYLWSHVLFRRYTPLPIHPHPRNHKSGWYASYWNSFLLELWNQLRSR